MKVVCPVDCGNAPRKEILRDWNIAWAGGDASAGELLADNIVYEPVGAPPIEGKAAVQAWLLEKHGTGFTVPDELHIHNIITHGNTAALNASLIMNDGRRFDYCHVYLFNGFSKTAKLKRITAYGIETEASRR